MTISELLSAQSAAGARYAAAVSELHDSLIELGGIDAALMNANVGFDGRSGIRTFFHLYQNTDQARLSHPVFARANLSVDWNDEIKARCNELIKETTL